MSVSRVSGCRFILRLVCLIGLLCSAVCMPNPADAEGLRGYLEYNYTKSDGNQRDSSGTTTRTDNSSLLQRYNLTMDKMFYPYLRFYAGGYVERGDSEFTSNGQTVDSSVSKFNPFADLTLTNPIISAGLGFNRREETLKTGGADSVTNVFENYNAKLGWKPEGLPSMDLLMSRMNAYDDNRLFQDTVTDTINLNTRYKPVEELELNYQGALNTLEDRLSGLETRTLTQSMRIAYGSQFFRDRVSLASSYNISARINEITAGSSGKVENYVPAISGYSNLITVISYDPLNEDLRDKVNPNLIQGDAQLQIGYLSLPPTLTHVSAALQIFASLSVNKMRVFVTAGGSDLALPDAVTQLFTFKVYTSTDNIGWEEVTSVVSTFGAFRSNITNTNRHGFELSFPAVSNRGYIKIVVVPRTIPANTVVGTTQISDMKIYNIENYFEETLPPGVTRTSHALSGLYDLNMKVKLLEEPSLFYDMTFTLDHSSNDTASSQRYLILNGLSLNHRFNSKLSGSARLAREDSVEPERTRASNTLSLALAANPLPTLAHSLVYSGRIEDENGAGKVQNSLFLTNSAELYRGFNVNLSAGGSMGRDEVGTDQKTFLVTAGASLQPHPTLSVNLSFSDSRQWLSGGGKPDQFTYTRLGDLSGTFNPLRSVYLFGGLSFVAQNDRETQYTRNIGGSWAPFRDGALLLNISYRESIATVSEEKDRNLVGSLRWNIRSGSYLDVSYLISKNSSLSQSSDTQTFSTSLRLSY